MRIEIRYGNTIHNDDTIAKVTTYTFNSIEKLREYWLHIEEERNLKALKWYADLKELTITKQEFVPSEEYFNNSGDVFTMEADF